MNHTKYKFIQIAILFLLVHISCLSYSQSGFNLDNGGQLVLTGAVNVVLQGATNLKTTSSVINIGGGTVTINGDLQGPGSFSGSSASTLVLNNSGNATLNFTTGFGSLKDFTLNCAGST